LILARRGLSALVRAAFSVGFSILVDGEFNGNLVSACEVCVGDFRVRDLKCWAVLDIEGEFRLAELGLSPVPATE